MSNFPETIFGLPKLTSSEFTQLSAFIYEQCGIKLPPAKKILLESRLNKRLRALHLTSFRDYVNYLQSKEGIQQELIHMIDEVTTNKTDFYREPHHFTLLNDQILPDFQRLQLRRPFKIWSAACSSGEEPYTLAIVLNEFSKENPGFDFNIIASDISTEILQKAVKAVYSMERVLPVPATLKHRYFLKSNDQTRPTVRVVPGLRNKVQFFRLNLMDKIFEMDDNLDVVFCRNVLIYFDRATQQEVLRKIVEKIRPGGYLFIGHSESLFQLDLPIVQVKPTVFKKK
ncbi:MAG: CheR family methyltransferase [Bacteroidia bacterium]